MSASSWSSSRFTSSSSSDPAATAASTSASASASRPTQDTRSTDATDRRLQSFYTEFGRLGESEHEQVASSHPERDAEGKTHRRREQPAVVKAHGGSAVLCVRYTRNGAYCVSGGGDRCVRLWNPSKLRLLRSFSGQHNSEILGVDAAPDNATVASGSADRRVCVWDVSTGRMLRSFRGHDARVNDVRFTPGEASLLLSAGYDTSIRCWDMRSRSHLPVQVLDQARDSVTCVDLLEGPGGVCGAEILSSSVDGAVRLYDLRKGMLRTEQLHAPVTCARYSHDQNCVLAASLDHRLRLLDRRNGQLFSTYRGHRAGSYRVQCALSHDDALVLCGDELGHVFAWDLVEAEVCARVDAHRSATSALQCHPTAPGFISAGLDGQLIVWQRRNASTAVGR